MKVKTTLSLLIILVFSALVSTPLLKEGLYTMHDDQQVARLFLFDESLKAGQFPPRWVSSLGFGFGYPLFVFYPPLVYLIGEMFHLLGFSLIESVKIVFFLGIFLSGISIFVLTRYLFGNFAATIASAFYIMVPYRAIDIYVRGALSESFSFVWPPLIFYSIIKLSRNLDIKSAVLTSILLALLMVTHNLIFLPFLLIILPFLLILLFTLKNKYKFTLLVISAFVMAAFLSAFFWMPALFEKKYTIVDDLLIVNLANYKIHFVYPTQLWNWTWGFGGSTAGIMDGISFKIGKLHILVSIIAFILSLLYLKLKKKLREEEKFTIRLIIFFFLLLLFSAFMTTIYSESVWNTIKPLAYLQFPWRFLTFTAFFTSILASAFIYLLKLPAFKLPAAIIITTILIATNFKLFRPQYYRPDFTDESATSYKMLTQDVSMSSFEYIPKGVELVKNQYGANTLNIKEEEIPNSKVEVISGKADINILRNNPQKIEFTANAIENSQIRVNVFDFPTWQLLVNGKKTGYSSNNKFKLITFNIDPGENHILLKFSNTPLRNSANLITVISFLCLMGYLSRSKWQTRRSK